MLLKAEYFAAPGSLIGRAYSISSDLSYGLYSVLESRGTGFFSGVYWSLQDDENTVFTIANVGEKETAARLELAHAGGKIELPPLKLLPNQTQTINLRRDLPRLLQGAGKELLAGALFGGYRMKSVDDPLRAELLVKEHVLSASKKTAAPFYASCNYVTSVWLSVPSSPVQVALGGTSNVWPMCTWNVGGNDGDYGATLQPDGGNEISISPQFGLTRTISGLNLGTRNMLLSSQVPTPPDPCEADLVQGTPVQAQVVCPIVVNFEQSNAESLGTGALRFTYTWSSSTGNLADLTECNVGESVYYPNLPTSPYVWPDPMVSSTPNPTVVIGPATTGQFIDTHDTPNDFEEPYSATSFNATQRYWWKCDCHQGGALQYPFADITITRSVFLDQSDSKWKYKATKQGVESTITLPGQ